MFDGQEDFSAPWHACTSGWCIGVDHLSASLISARMPKLFGLTDSGGIGLILADDAPFECAFTRDGGTQFRQMGGCTHAAACSPESSWQCAWRPSQLAEAVATMAEVNGDGINEFVVSRARWEAGLPGLVAAVLCMGQQCEAPRARALITALRAAYPDAVPRPPLLRYVPASGWGSDAIGARGFTELT